MQQQQQQNQPTKLNDRMMMMKKSRLCADGLAVAASGECVFVALFFVWLRGCASLGARWKLGGGAAAEFALGNRRLRLWWW